MITIFFRSVPARGKTHISRSLCRYMRWLGVSAKVFSVGNYRRDRMGSIPNEYFDPSKPVLSTYNVHLIGSCCFALAR